MHSSAFRNITHTDLPTLLSQRGAKAVRALGSVLVLVVVVLTLIGARCGPLL